MSTAQMQLQRPNMQRPYKIQSQMPQQMPSTTQRFQPQQQPIIKQISPVQPMIPQQQIVQRQMFQQQQPTQQVRLGMTSPAVQQSQVIVPQMQQQQTMMQGNLNGFHTQATLQAIEESRGITREKLNKFKDQKNENLKNSQEAFMIFMNEISRLEIELENYKADIANRADFNIQVIYKEFSNLEILEPQDLVDGFRRLQIGTNEDEILILINRYSNPYDGFKYKLTKSNFAAMILPQIQTDSYQHAFKSLGKDEYPPSDFLKRGLHHLFSQILETEIQIQELKIELERKCIDPCAVFDLINQTKDGQLTQNQLYDLLYQNQIVVTKDEFSLLNNHDEWTVTDFERELLPICLKYFQEYDQNKNIEHDNVDKEKEYQKKYIEEIMYQQQGDEEQYDQQQYQQVEEQQQY